jgi:hypothetical protein
VTVRFFEIVMRVGPLFRPLKGRTQSSGNGDH